MKRPRSAVLYTIGAIAALIVPVAAAGAADAAGGAATVAAQAARPAACGTAWGTNAKQGGPANPVSTKVKAVRAGQQPCFDRLVIDLGVGTHPGYRVSYVSKIIADPSGKTLSMRGKAFLLIVVRGPAGPSYHANAVDLVNVTGFAVFRQVRGAGSFESVTSIGLGLKAKANFRAFILSGPGATSRLVVDVAR